MSKSELLQIIRDNTSQPSWMPTIIEALNRYTLHQQANLLRGIISDNANSIESLTRIVNELQRQIEAGLATEAGRNLET